MLVFDAFLYYQINLQENKKASTLHDKMVQYQQS